MTSFEYDDEDEFARVEALSELIEGKPRRIRAIPVKCYLRGLRRNEFLNLKWPDELRMDHGKSNDGDNVGKIVAESSPAPSTDVVESDRVENQWIPKMSLLEAAAVKSRFGRRERFSSRGFHSCETDGDSSDSLDDYDIDDERRDENDDEARNDEAEVSDHGSLSTISSIEESDLTRLSSREKRRREVKEKRKEERRRVAKNERRKDEENYRKIIEIAESLKPGSRASGRHNQSASVDSSAKERERGATIVSEERDPSMTGAMADMKIEEDDNGELTVEISGGAEGRDGTMGDEYADLVLPPPPAFSSPSPENSPLFGTPSSSSPTDGSLSRSVDLPSPLCHSQSTPSPPLSSEKSPRAISPEADFHRASGQFTRSLTPGDALSPEANAQRDRARDLPSPHRGLKDIEEETPMSIFRATVAAERPTDYPRGSVDDGALGEEILGATAAPFGPSTSPEMDDARPRHPTFPRQYEKMRARLHRPDDQVDDEKIRHYTRRKQSEKSRVLTGNTIKMEKLPMCMNLIQLKDLLDFVGRNGILKMKLERVGSSSTAHVKFRDESLAITALSLLDGCVLKSTDPPLSCTLV